MKKSIKFSAVLLSVSMSVSALPIASASGYLQLSDPTYTDADETVIPNPQPGFVKTSITATNNGESTADAYLVVSATDNTGKIQSIDDSLPEDGSTPKKIPGNGGSEVLSAGITLASGQAYNYYVWDSLINHTPLRNTAPTDIKDLESSVKTNSVDLSWADSLDDKGIKNYILKVNGNEVARSKEPSYSVLGLERNSEYTLEIAACDEEGVLSKNSTFVNASTYGVEECILTENDNNNFEFYENFQHPTLDSYTEHDFIGGRDCIKNTEQEVGSNKKVGHFYFPVKSTYINQNMNNVAIEVTYFDDDLGAPSIQYNAEDGSSGKQITLGNRTNTKTWKTVYVELSDAKFTNPEALTYSAFRVSAPKGTRVYKVALCPGDVYSPDVPNVKFGDNTTDTYDMLFYPESAVSAYNIDYNYIGDVACMYAPNGGTFEFDIKDSCARRTGGYIEVTYYDDADDSLVLKYNDVRGSKSELVEFTGTQEFKTVQIPLDASSFSNAISGADDKKFDFTLSTQNGCPLALTSVKYVPGDSDYVPEPITEVYAQVNANGTGFDGDLSLKRWVGSYDRNIAFSGEKALSSVDGKHYSFNEDYGSDKGWRRWKNSWVFDIPNDFLAGEDYENVEVKIEYYVPDTNGATLTLFVNTDSTKYDSSISGGQWATKVFTISKNDGKNATFSDGYGDGDIKLQGDRQVYISKVTVKKITQ